MGIKIEWGNEAQTVIEAHADWPWTWDELATGWKAAAEMMRGVSHTVHLIAVSHTARMPMGSFLSNIKHITRDVPDNLGLAIMVTENRFQQIMNSVLFQISPRLSRVGHVVSNLEAAYTIIEREGSKFNTPTSVNRNAGEG